MALNRAQKQEILGGYGETLADAQHAFVIGFKGITVTQATELRSRIKKVRTALAAKDKAGAQQAFREAASVIDRLVGKGLVHKNAAARYKSGLNQQLRALA